MPEQIEVNCGVEEELLHREVQKKSLETQALWHLMLLALGLFLWRIYNQQCERSGVEKECDFWQCKDPSLDGDRNNFLQR